MNSNNKPTENSWPLAGLSALPVWNKPLQDGMTSSLQPPPLRAQPRKLSLNIGSVLKKLEDSLNDKDD
eukprot:CAMPEP_0170491986 /NCGR_PEP_ID=MMETSP0208-20121228/11485_1 /TAXON_ID=197538 /ORGANISM="Strombidium inclinatum, Strain S3" /LENGTH=67 /DNA_ID=CAMNT_0010767659 /DNA_START=32 /DNA_END=235 /DNA_ORIENTATION=+